MIAPHSKKNLRQLSGLTRNYVIGLGIVSGLLAGSIGMVPVWLIQSARGVSFIPQMQLAASGVVGIDAYTGMNGFILGVMMHYLVSILPAIIYAIVAVRFPRINYWAWIAGPVFGLGVLLVMGVIVLPHSAIVMPAPMTPMPPLAALLIHMFAFGLPIALIVRLGLLRKEVAPVSRTGG